MAATVRISHVTGAAATPAFANAEGGARYGRDEVLASATPVPRPAATGTAYSWAKVYCLEVTTTDPATSMSNFRYRMSAAPQTGFTLWFNDMGATYAQSTAPIGADSATNDADPDGVGPFVAAATADTQYDAGSYATSTLGRKGDFIAIGAGVSNLYTAGANPSAALPNLVITFDEA